MTRENKAIWYSGLVICACDTVEQAKAYIEEQGYTSEDVNIFKRTEPDGYEWIGVKLK